MIDPLKNEWRPTTKQSQFLSLPYTIFEAFFGGGVGGGKSDVLLLYGIVHKWHKNPRFKQVFMRRTFPELRNEIVPRSREIYSKFGAKFNKMEMTWTFPREDQFGSGYEPAGAIIFLAHCENENDVHNYDSMEINLWTPDELTSFTEYIYLYVGFTRVRSSDPNLPSLIRAGGMPGGVGHKFCKKRFVDPAKDGNTIIVGRAGVKRFYVHATFLDNEHIDPTYKQKILALPEAERKAKLGDWDAFQGQVFDELRDRKYPGEPDNALHVCEPFEIPEYWPKFVVIDWGYSAMNYVGFYAVSPQKRLYLYRELVWLTTKINEWAPIVLGFIEKENPRMIKVCKSAGQERGQDQTIQEQIASALNRPVELSNNSPGSRVAGKMLVHEYLRWKQKPTLPRDEVPIYNEELALRIYRMRGEEAYHDYLKMFAPIEPETNIPRAQFFLCSADNHDGHPNCCPVMIESLKTCSYDKKTKEGKTPEDVMEFEGDDPYDNFRYACDSAENFFTLAEQEFKKVQRQETLIHKLQDSQDWTAFYRDMRRIESDGIIKPVSRYRH